MLVLTFQVGPNRLALDIRQVREVVPRVRLDRAAGSPEWLAGLFVYRGKVVPVIDLHRLLNAGECPSHLSSRIILVPLASDQRLVGLLAAEVADIHDVATNADSLPGLHVEGQPNLGMTVVDGGGILHLLELDGLLPESLQRLVLQLPAPI